MCRPASSGMMACVKSSVSLMSVKKTSARENLIRATWGTILVGEIIRSGKKQENSMISMTIRNAKMNFSRILSLVENGEDIVIRNRQRPVAKISSFKEDGKIKGLSFLDDLSKFRATQKPAGVWKKG